jgi:hypothetical protein
MLHFPIRKSTFHGSGQCIPKKEEGAEEEVVTGTEQEASRSEAIGADDGILSGRRYDHATGA